MDEDRAEDMKSHLVIAWKTLAVVGALVGVGLLTTLAIVATKVGADPLSTTALSLAVVAFGAQLIVYVAQTADTSAMRRQASDVNGATQSALTEIRTTVEKSDNLLRDQVTVMLNNLLEQVKRKQAERKDADSSLDASDVINVISSAARSTADGPSGAPLPREIQAMERDFAAWEDSTPAQLPFGGWPAKDDAPRAFAILSTLDPVSIGQLMRYAEDHELSWRLHSKPGLVYSGPEVSPFSCRLIKAGLVATEDRHPSGRPPKEGFRPVYATLTEEGRIAAQLVMARGSAPDYVKALLAGAGGDPGNPPGGATKPRP